MKLGVALGGGGAKGLAHISMIEVLDEMGLRPHRIAGTSIGAILGVLYASGRSGGEIREALVELTAAPRTLRQAVKARQLPGWLDVVGLDVGRGRLLQVDKFLTGLEDFVGVSRLEDLAVPLQVVAADFWARTQVVFDSGPLVQAVSASFALPGIFRPVVIDGRVLVDGGSVNPVPFDLLQDDCDIVVAIDALGRRRPNDKLLPSYSEVLFNTFQIAERTILHEKMKAAPPTVIYVEPEIHDVRVLEFHKADRVYAQTAEAASQLRKDLQAMIASVETRAGR